MKLAWLSSVVAIVGMNSVALAAEPVSHVVLEAELTATGRITVETVPGTSHFLPMERPDLVVAILRRAASA